LKNGTHEGECYGIRGTRFRGSEILRRFAIKGGKELSLLEGGDKISAKKKLKKKKR